MDAPTKSNRHDENGSDAAKAAAATADEMDCDDEDEFDDDEEEFDDDDNEFDDDDYDSDDDFDDDYYFSSDDDFDDEYDIHIDYDEDSDAYAIASKDLKSLIAWNFNDLNRYGQEDDTILDEWDAAVRKVEELGRPPRHDEKKLVATNQMIHRVITFPQLCRDVENNDPKTTTIEFDTYKYPSGYARPLGKALLGNTHVSTLKLELDTLFPRDGRVQRPMMVSFLKPLLHYIESGPALRKLVFTSHFGDFKPTNGVMNSFLQSAAKSGNVEELDMYPFRIKNNVSTFCGLLQQTASIRSLSVSFSIRQELEPEYATKIAQVAEALGSNTTLEILKFHPGSGDSEFVDLVLSRLSAHPCLKEFHLDHFTFSWVSPFLQLSCLPALLTSPTSQLRVLYLKGCAFNRDRMNDLISGLTVCRTMEKLVFDECHLDDDAKAVFIRFFQSTDSECKLRELGFRADRPQSFNDTIFDSTSAADLTIQLLQPNPSETNCTNASIGSLITRFTFDFEDSSHFWAAYASNASKIRLSCLHLGLLRERDWKDLKQYLPSILYLRELSINVWIEGIPASTFNQVLRSNGSVQAVHMEVDGEIPLDELISQTPAEKRLFESMLLRNQHVPKLLTSPRLIATGTTNGGAGQAIHGKDAGTAPAMIPPLFQVMAPAEHMQPNTVLQGLLAFKNSFGASTRTVKAKQSLPIAVTPATSVTSPMSSGTKAGKEPELAASPMKSV